MSSKRGLRSDVSFMPTAPFVRAFGAEEAARQGAKAAVPTWQHDKLPPEATKPVATPSTSTCTVAHADERMMHAFAVGCMCGAALVLLCVAIFR